MTNEIKEAITEALELVYLKKIIKGELLKAVNELEAKNDRWITLKPHGKEADDYKRLLIKDGEDVEDAMHRQGYYKKRQAKTEKTLQELKKEKDNAFLEAMKAQKAGDKEAQKEWTKKFHELKEQIANLEKGKPEEKQPEEKKPEPQEPEVKEPKEEKPEDIKDDDAVIKKLSEISEETEKLESEKWNYSYGSAERNKIEQKLTELQIQSNVIFNKASFKGESWKNADGDTVTISKFEDGKFVIVTEKNNKYGTYKNYEYFRDANKIFEVKAADTKAFEKAEQKRKEKEARTSKKVEYKKGGMPKAKTREEALKLAQEYNIADNIHYGSLSVDVCNAMNESANDILAEFPKIRSLNKEFGSLQAKNKNLIDEAFEIQGESLAIPIRENLKRIKARYGEEYFTKYYGNKEKIEKRITEKVKDILKRKIGIYKASGEIAHCRYVPPEQAGIVWNEKYKNSKNFDWCIGFHPEGATSLKATCDHEFGHQIERYIKLHGGDNSAAYNALQSYHRSLSREDIKNGLSGYALTNLAEFIAEGFSEYKNNPNPRPIAQKIGALLTQAYKEVENNV